VPSADLQQGCDTLHSQEVACREYAQLKSYFVKKVFRDEGSMSAGYMLPGMRNLLRNVTKEREEILVLSDTSIRLGFKPKIRESVRKAILNAGAQFIAINDEHKFTPAFIQEELFQKNSGETNV